MYLVKKKINNYECKNFLFTHDSYKRNIKNISSCMVRFERYFVLFNLKIDCLKKCQKIFHLLQKINKKIIIIKKKLKT